MYSSWYGNLLIEKPRLDMHSSSKNPYDSPAHFHCIYLLGACLFSLGIIQIKAKKLSNYHFIVISKFIVKFTIEFEKDAMRLTVKFRIYYEMCDKIYFKIYDEKSNYYKSHLAPLAIMDFFKSGCVSL